jgi:hypothetical protein
LRQSLLLVLLRSLLLQEAPATADLALPPLLPLLLLLLGRTSVLAG